MFVVWIIIMFKKRWLHAFGELGNVKEVVEYVSRCASEASSANV
jgi:hypothetical protein